MDPWKASWTLRRWFNNFVNYSRSGFITHLINLTDSIVTLLVWSNLLPNPASRDSRRIYHLRSWSDGWNYMLIRSPCSHVPYRWVRTTWFVCVQDNSHRRIYSQRSFSNYNWGARYAFNWNCKYLISHKSWKYTVKSVPFFFHNFNTCHVIKMCLVGNLAWRERWDEPCTFCNGMSAENVGNGNTLLFSVHIAASESCIQSVSALSK